MYHIVICDDEKHFTAELQNLLYRYSKETGIEIKVTVYFDGLELTQNYPPDINLIFLDIKMAHVDGLQAAKAIRRMDSKVSIIFLTSMAQYALEGLILDTFSENYRIVDGVFDKKLFTNGGYVVAQAVGGAEESEKEAQPTYSVGDTVLIHGMELEVMCIAADITPITEGPNGEKTFLSFYLPRGTFQHLYPENTMRKLFFNVDINYREAAEAMLIDYQGNIDKNLSYKSKPTLIEHYKDQTRASTIMGFSISIIIAIVGILNFINSMVTAIVSRQKEFAMLQSIGMTKRQLRNMLIFEGFDYAAFTLALSFLLGIIAVGVGVRAMVSGDWTATFNFNITPLFICMPTLFVFAAVIPYVCFRNLEKQSVVEKQRNTD